MLSHFFHSLIPLLKRFSLLFHFFLFLLSLLFATSIGYISIHPTRVDFHYIHTTVILQFIPLEKEMIFAKDTFLFYEKIFSFSFFLNSLFVIKLNANSSKKWNTFQEKKEERKEKTKVCFSIHTFSVHLFCKETFHFSLKTIHFSLLQLMSCYKIILPFQKPFFEKNKKNLMLLVIHFQERKRILICSFLCLW